MAAKEENKAIHLVAGGVAGTLAAVVTCPLDVAKTRLQSSIVTSYRPSLSTVEGVATHSGTTSNGRNVRHLNRPAGLYKFLKHLVRTEGAGALFKGLGPTLIGIAPSRSIYFFTYAQCKRTYRELIEPNSKSGCSMVHLLSAGTAGAMTTTITNPIWLIKTRLQLDEKKGVSESTTQCIRRVYQREGMRGFYRGLTASYYGVVETAIHFVIYEALRERFIEPQGTRGGMGAGGGGGHREEGGRASWLLDVCRYMTAAATSKTIATCIAYPHEVARTRMREEGGRYVKFWPTLRLVAQEEGVAGLYRGLGTQLIKHIPNAAIMLAAYEVIVELCNGFGRGSGDNLMRD